MFRAPKKSWFYKGQIDTNAQWRICCHGTAGFTLQFGQTTFELDRHATSIPIPSKITEPTPWPPLVWDLRHGMVWHWHIHMNGLRIVQMDSADPTDEEFVRGQADVVCLCAIGRQHRPSYCQSVVRALNSKWIIPCDWDWVLTPYEAIHCLLPGPNPMQCVEEIADAGVRPVLIPLEDELCLSHSDLTK